MATAKSVLEKPLKLGREFLLRLPHGSDIIEHLTDLCAKHEIHCASVNLIGAASKVTIGYYDQKNRRYQTKTFDQEMEIVSCIGNVSLKDGKPFLHLHATLADTELRCWGGHLFPGTRVFVSEVSIQELKGALRVRMPDVETGLALWCQEK